MTLKVLIGIDGGEPQLATGSCSRTLLESLGYDPTYFREQGHQITSWAWQKTHDGYRQEQIEEKPKGKKLGSKTIDKLEKRMAAWNS